MARLGYCSACDRNVPVVLRKPLEHDATPSTSDANALVCLDYGVRCTGNLCPLFTPGHDGLALEQKTRRAGPSGSYARSRRRRPEVRATWPT